MKINVENFGKDPESMSKMKAMGLTFLYKDMDVKKKLKSPKYYRVDLSIKEL